MNVRVTIVTKRFNVEDDGCYDEGHKSDQVSPDVPGFRMNPENWTKTFGKGRQLRPVAKMKIVIVPEKKFCLTFFWLWMS